MSREVKRVPMWFRAKLSEVWIGYRNPWRHYAGPCECDGTGQNPATKQIGDEWYDHGGDGSKRWCYAITQDEVDALVEAGRLHDLTSTFTPGSGWAKDPAKPHPTAEQVNAWAQSERIFGHDAINRWICVETRAKRLGVYGVCEKCGGEGIVWATPEAKAASEAWQPVEPPTGDGWQLWETTSEGSPISAVCATPEALASWCVKNGASTFASATTSYENWLAFIKKGWAMSMVVSAKGPQSGVDAVAEGS